MKFIEDSFDFVPQAPGVEGMYLQMEKAARQCYKTEDLIKEGSAHRIIDDTCIAHGHTSVTEFGTVYLKMSIFNPHVFRYLKDRYSRIALHGLYAYITTTYRTIIQGDYKDPVESIRNGFDRDWKDDLQYWEEPTKYHHKRYCYHFVMDRVGSQSVERHRGVYGVSYAQESTRYINYNRDKFGREITVVYPSKFYELREKYNLDDSMSNKDADEYLYNNDNGWKTYVNELRNSEKTYLTLVNDEGWKPEDARGTLNLDIKTEFLMCAYEEDWRMFLFRRADSHAHPHIQLIANKLVQDFWPRVK